MKTLTLLFFLFSITAYSQVDNDKVREYQLQQEAFRKSQLLQKMDSGKMLMENGEYVLAEKKFKYVLDNIKSVPSDLTYYFGKNSYLQNKYKQSIDWLTKYIQLKGTSGQYYNDAVLVLQKAEASLLETRKIETSQISEVLSRNYDIDCGPGGKVVCPVCRGTTVIIKPGLFGNTYKTCNYCDKHGLLSCPEYNQLVRGELTEQH
jgi:tetratricopeptide (TPR) repeat protein